MDYFKKMDIINNMYILIPKESQFKSGDKLYFVKVVGYIVLAKKEELNKVLDNTFKKLKEKLSYKEFIEQKRIIYSSIEEYEVIRKDNYIKLSADLQNEYNISDSVILLESNNNIKVFPNEEEYKKYLETKKALQ